MAKFYSKIKKRVKLAYRTPSSFRRSFKYSKQKTTKLKRVQKIKSG